MGFAAPFLSQSVIFVCSVSPVSITVLLIHTGNTCSCRLSFQKQSTNKNLLFHFRKVCCVVYFIENFVENSLGFCNLFSQCVCTLHTSFHGSYRKNFVVKFPCHRLFSYSLFFLPNWQPSKIIIDDFLLLGKIFKLPSYSNQFFSNLIKTSSRERVNFGLQYFFIQE